MNPEDEITINGEIYVRKGANKKIELPYPMLGRLVMKLKNSTTPVMISEDTSYATFTNSYATLTSSYATFISREALLDAKRIAEEYGFTIDTSFMEASK